MLFWIKLPATTSLEIDKEKRRSINLDQAAEFF
jgi:hypothetical protein